MITTIGGAALHSNMIFTIALNETAGLGEVQEDAIINLLSAAATDWGRYITGHAPLHVARG